MGLQKELGKHLKAARKSKKITQKQLAQMIGKTASSIQKYESGEQYPPIDVIEAIAHALKMDIRDMIFAAWDVPAGTKIAADFGDGEEIFTVDENGIAAKWEPSSPNDKHAALLHAFNLLNESGQDKAVAYTEDLTRIDDYRKK